MLPDPYIVASAVSSSTAAISILGGLIAALIAVAGGVGTWAALRVAKNSQLIANYQAAAASWETVADGLKAEKESLEGQLTEAKTTNATLQAKNTILQELATGHPLMESLTAGMNSGFEKLGEQLAGIEKTLRGDGT